MIEYRYRHYTGFDKKGELLVIYRPNALVEISNGTIKKPYDMLVDSGADVSLITKKVGEELGLEIISEREIDSLKGIGGEIPVVYKYLYFIIGDYTVRAKVGWAMTNDIPLVLGREDIFDTFRVEFLQDKKITRFHKIKK